MERPRTTTLSHSVLKELWPGWPVLFSLSHRPHTGYAETCTQGFPDIICPALSSASVLVASFPCLRSTSKDTNKHKRAAVHKRKHARTVVPTLSSLGLSLVGIVFASVATHGCVSSWDTSIATIPAIHLSLWLGARRDELCVLVQGIHNLFSVLSISPYCLSPDKLCEVSVKASWPKLQPTQNAFNETHKMKKTDRETDRPSW